MTMVVVTPVKVTTQYAVITGLDESREMVRFVDNAGYAVNSARRLREQYSNTTDALAYYRKVVVSPDELSCTYGQWIPIPTAPGVDDSSWGDGI